MEHDGFCMRPRQACYLNTCACLCHGEAVSLARQRQYGIRPLPSGKN